MATIGPASSSVNTGVVFQLRNSPHSAVIIKGILELTDKDVTKQIFKKDDAFNEVVNIIHSAKVIGETPVEVIVFYAGTKKLPLTIFTKNN